VVHPGKNGYFEIGGNDVAALVALLLRQRRSDSGLSLADVAQRIGAKSRNAYARYEQGKSMPTVEKLIKLLVAIDPTRDLVLGLAKV
jgi:transcriptional regulator with XRE-family HTH domain